MRYRALLSILILIIFLYLNRSYAYFYYSIGQHLQLPPPNYQHLNIGKENLKQTLKLVTLGDSLTAGVGSQDYHHTIPFLIGQSLTGEETRVTVINLAVPGARSKQVLEDQVPKAVLEKPDFITLFVGINDIHNFVSIKDFQKDYSQILDALSTKTSAKITVINIPYLGRKNILLPPFDFLLDFKTKQFNEIIKQIAQNKKIKYIDLYAQTKKQFQENNDLYSIDGFHPSNKGYLFLGEIINADSDK